MSDGAVREPYRRTGTLPVILLLVVAVLAGLVFGFSPKLNPLDIISGRFNEVEIPDVVEETQTAALVALDQRGLEGSVTFAYSDAVARGLVVEQDPAAGSTISEGSTVDVVVSRGAPSRVVPDLAAVDVDTARALVEGEQMELNVAELHDEFSSVGEIIGQDPRPGSPGGAGDTVTVLVSLGPAPRAVPDVIGISLEGAAYEIGRARFTLGGLIFVDDPEIPVGAVIATDPAPGTMLDVDTPIGIAVSGGEALVEVPLLVGLGLADAEAQLEARGLVAGTVTGEGIGDVADEVLSQDPPSGTQVRPGEVVTLTIAAGRPSRGADG